MTTAKVSQNVEIITLRGEKRFLTAKELFWLDVLKEGYLVQDPSPLNKGVFRWAKKVSKFSNTFIGDKAGSYCVNGYVRISVKFNTIKAHHLSFLLKHGYIPDIIDHKDQVKDNNWWENLRDSTSGENGQNKSKANKDSKSGIRGVAWNKWVNKWHAQISINRKSIYLGYFDELSDAIEARKQGELKYHPYAPSNRDN